jgi:hypothetical protein
VLMCDMYSLSWNEVVEFMCGVRISSDKICKLESQCGYRKSLICVTLPRAFMTRLE